MTKQTLGKLPPHGLRPAGTAGAAARPCSTVFARCPISPALTSDAMDELGIVGAVPAAVLRPNDPSARVVGRALTVRNIAGQRAGAGQGQGRRFGPRRDRGP